MNVLATMSSVHHLKEFISARLTAAAEEIFSEFEKTIEEEIDRRSRMLEITWKPHTHLQTADLLLHDINETKVCLIDQELCNQDRSFTMDQQQAEPPQIKEQQEELCISPQEDQLILKEEPVNRDNVKTESNSEQVFIENSSEETLACEGSDREEPESEKNPDRNRSNHDESHSKNKRNNSALKKGKLKKLFKCDSCGKTFVRKSSLNIHQRRHTGETPYCCLTCGKGFVSSTLLNRHEIIHTDVRPYCCDICGKGFTTKGHLTQHIRTHTGEKPFTCDTCGKKFANRQYMKVHKRIHTGEKPYSCEICGQSFSHNRTLIIHKVKAHQCHGLNLTSV